MEFIEANLATLLMGIAIGVILHRWIIMEMIQRYPMTICDYCKWDRERRGRY